ncbi:MAG: fructose-bisphosphate aldolase class II [Paracoccaceae bacterium]|nr:fructose-bisphosphate aldolase class II [Paracoccaceae bacterium]
MALISLRQLLDHAAEHGYGVPAFNISNMEQGLAIMNAARASDAPVILQASLNVRQIYAGDRMIVNIVLALAEQFPDTPICLHQDHGNTEKACLSAIQAGFTSAMMDGSLEADAATPASYAYNIDVTARVAEMAHWVGASVEGELGVLGSLQTGEAAKEDGSAASGRLSRDQLLTDPDQAADFVMRTKVDALAIACGTSHGAYKFTRKPDGEILAMDQIEAVHARLPDTHLVMHGSSSVPQYLQDLINENGGEMPQTWGVPVEEIERGIRSGVRKINIDTDCRMAMSGAMRRYAREHPEVFDPRKFILAAVAELETLVRDRFERFGTAGHGSSIRVIPLPEMARRYEKGALDPRVAAV